MHQNQKNQKNQMNQQNNPNYSRKRRQQTTHIKQHVIKKLKTGNEVSKLSDYVFTTAPTTVEEEIKKLSERVILLTKNQNTIIDQNQTQNEAINELNKDNEAIKKHVNHIHEDLYKNCIVIKNLGVDITNINEAKMEVGKLVGFILKENESSPEKNYSEHIREIVSVDKDFKIKIPLKIKVQFNNLNIAQDVLKNAKKSKEFVRKNTAITGNMWINKYNSPADQEKNAELGDAIKLFQEHQKIIKSSNPMHASPTIKGHFTKIKINGQNKTLNQALTFFGFTKEELQKYSNFKTANPDSNDETIQNWIKNEKPHLSS